MDTPNSTLGILKILQDQGFTHDFRAEEDGLRCLQNKRLYTPAEVSVEVKHRSDGMTNPDDDKLILGIKTIDGVKGTLYMSYGAQHSQNPEILKQL